jgi:hypothetical protein
VSTTSEVEIRIKGDDDSDSAFRKARNNEERLAASAKAAGIELTVMGRKGEAAGKITADGADRACASPSGWAPRARNWRGSRKSLNRSAATAARASSAGSSTRFPAGSRATWAKSSRRYPARSRVR